MTLEEGHTDLYALKDSLPYGLPANLSGHTPIVKRNKFWVHSSEEDRHRFLNRICGTLRESLDDETVDEIYYYLDESLMNVGEHVHKFDRRKRALVNIYRIDDILAISVQHEPVKFNPACVRTNACDTDGTPYMGTRGRGHILMAAYADRLFYPRTFVGDDCFVSEQYGAKRLKN